MKKSLKQILIYSTKQENEIKTENKSEKGAYNVAPNWLRRGRGG